MHNPIHGRFALADGREVYLTRLLLTPTYEGMLEGTPAMASRFIRERLADDVARGLPNMPLAILDDGKDELPRYRWAAAFDSRRGVGTNDPDYNSHLALCWFSATLPTDLLAAITVALAQVDWDAHAEDYDIMP